MSECSDKTAKSSKKINLFYYTKCPSCLRIPLIKLLNLSTVQISCPNKQCEVNKKPLSIPIEEFIKNNSIIKNEFLSRQFCTLHKNKLKKLICVNCKDNPYKCKECKKNCKKLNHKIYQINKLFTLETKCNIEEHNSPVAFFCDTCNLHICQKCKDDKLHNDHKLISLKTTLMKDELKNDFQKLEVLEYINKRNFSLNKEIVRKIKFLNLEEKYKERLNLLISTANTYNKTNKTIVQFYRLLLDEYNRLCKEFLNYYVYTNLKENLKVNFELFKIEYQTEDQSTVYENMIDRMIYKYKTSFIFKDINGKIAEIEKDSTISETEKKKERNEILHVMDYAEAKNTEKNNEDFNKELYPKSVSEIINYPKKHTKVIYKLICLKDNRLCTCSEDGLVIVYSKINFNDLSKNDIDFIINDHDGKGVKNICQLENEILLSCSLNNKINLYKLTDKSYVNIYPTIKLDGVNNIINLPGNKFCATSYDGSINIYHYNIKETFKNPLYFYHPDKKLDKININGLYFSIYSNILITIDVENTACFWDISKLNYDTMKGFEPVDVQSHLECTGINSMHELIDVTGENFLLIGTNNGVTVYNLKTLGVETPAYFDEKLNSSHSFIGVKNGFVMDVNCANKLIIIDTNIDIRKEFKVANDKSSSVNIVAKIDEEYFGAVTRDFKVKIFKFEFGETNEVTEKGVDNNKGGDKG